MNWTSKMINAKRFLYICFMTAAVCLGANGQNDGSEQNQNGRAGTFAIVGARIVTVSGATIENGTVVIQNGKIAAVGAGIAAPTGAETIDGHGLTVFPGMIDANTTLGMAEIPLGVPGSVDSAEVGQMNANAKAIKGINPHSSHVEVARINGITTVVSTPLGGIIAGQAAIINMIGSTQDEMAVVREFGLMVNFPRLSTFAGFGFGGPQAIEFTDALKRRDSQLDELKKLFTNAENYLRAKEAYSHDRTLPMTPTDERYDAMAPYLRGERPVMFNAERDRDIRAAVRFIRDHKLKGIIVGGQDAWKVADDLKKNDIPVIFTEIYQLPVQDDDPYDVLYAAPGKLAAAGVKFCISTGNDGAEVRDLPYHAGIAGSFGLSHEDALKSVTLYPAQILGIADRLGSIETGKIANLVVTDGDMLEPRTNVKYLFINGHLMPLTSRHTRLFDSFKDRK
jgi:imidazolonepropionase-like amidohydrolase